MPSPHPDISDAPGLRWRARADGWVAVWVASVAMVRRGYATKTQRLWPPSSAPYPGPPTEADVAMIRAECERLQTQMMRASLGTTLSGLAYDGTLGSLIDYYRRDPDSPYQQLRFRSRETYDAFLDPVVAQVGSRRLKSLGFRDFRRWYEIWSENGAHVPRAGGRMTMVRLVIAFGVMAEISPHCLRLDQVLGKMQFSRGKPRDAIMTAAQTDAVRTAAHAAGLHSLAFAEALRFSLIMRPKDVLGEWLPMTEPGISDVTDHGDKWLHGLRWSEVDAAMVLRHRLSKSLRGRGAVLDPRAGEVKEWDLTLYPMVMQEIASIPLERRAGPMIVNEGTGVPWRAETFRAKWRAIADAAGIPRSIQSRDSRAGGITDAVDVTGGDLEATRHAAGHKQITTTQRYSRNAAVQTAKVARLRRDRGEG